MTRSEITKEQLANIASCLGDGWRYHSLMSDDKECYGHWLHNGAGAYICVNYEYGKTLPQWSMQYKHPKYNNYMSFCVIGCDIRKPLSRIINDLETRLLSRLSEMYRKLQEDTDKLLKEREQSDNNRIVIEALSRVINLELYYDNNRLETYRISRPDGEHIATIAKGFNNANFNMKIDNVTPEEIIQITQMLNR